MAVRREQPWKASIRAHSKESSTTIGVHLNSTIHALVIEALKGHRLKLGDTHPHTLDSWHNLIDLYEARNKPEEAEEWRAKLAQMDALEE